VEDAQLRELYPHLRTDKVAQILGRSTSAIYGRADVLGLEKTAEYLASPEACRLRRENSPGIAHRFPKGHVPANKGTRRPGWSVGRMRETQFKKGQRNGTAAANYMPVGSTRLFEGYVLLKVAEVPNAPHMVNWKLLHVLNWERANGRPVPDGHCLRFRDGNRQNCDVANLELITRQENAKRNTIHRFPEPIKRAIRAKAWLTRRINRMERERAEQHA
jgi:hypothetical protein